MSPSRPGPPNGYAYGPPYRIALSLILEGAFGMLRGRPRSLARDALKVLAHMPAPPQVRGSDRVPEDGTFVVVANHYERPGLWMAWPALLISQVVASRMGRELHWIAIQEWDSFSLWGIPVPRRVTRAVFERAFATYGIIAMPPPDAPRAERAGAMRQAVAEVRQGALLGLMPEGTVGPTPELLPAREGAGAFLLLLVAAGARLLPAGIYEEGGRLVVEFGEPFALELPRGLAKEERDAWTRRHVMAVIAALLPAPLRGTAELPG